MLTLSKASTEGQIIIRTHTADNAGSALKFQKSRNTTESGFTIVSDGDYLGSIEFQASDSNSFEPGAAIRARINGTVSDGSATPTDLIFLTSSAQSYVERMRILSSGNVGIGTAAPASSLHIVGGNLLIADGEADDAIKQGRIGSEHYDVDEEPFYYLYSIIQNGNNQINIGGGTSSGNAANLIKFYTAANSTTTTGTSVMTLDSNSRISLSNNDSGTSNTLFGKLAGAALASGGN